MEEAGEGLVIFYGRYRFNVGAYRPSLTAYVLSTDGRWVKHSFLLDTGADVTFLPRRSIAMLRINVAIFDRAKGQVLLLDPSDRYEVVRG
jgi:hypothetical protein